MSLNDLLEALTSAPESIEFDDVMSVITENYHYSPTEFKNGLDDKAVTNNAGTNEGSCKVFYFAQLQNLDKQTTLYCFGRNYRDDVLANPGASNHQNIRNFMVYGMDGIEFSGEVLVAK